MSEPTKTEQSGQPSLKEAELNAALQAAKAQIKVLEGALEWFIQHEKSLTLDVQSAHHSRGNGTTQWMTEDDREFRSDLRAAFDTARSALPQFGGENG